MQECQSRADLLEGLPYFSLYDIRRTFATVCDDLTVRGGAISAVLDHVGIDMGQASPMKVADITRVVYDYGNEPGYRSPYRFMAFAELAIGNYPGYLAALKRKFSLTDDPAGLRVAAAGERGLRGGGAEAMAQAMVSTAKARHLQLGPGRPSVSSESVQTSVPRPSDMSRFT